MAINKYIKKIINIHIKDIYGIFDVNFCCNISNTKGINENESKNIAKRIR